MKANILKRVFSEVQDVNADFFNLRTVITPDAYGDVTHFRFMMLPNDGAMAHLTLVGALYIPENYPEDPPVVQLYTTTQRYNVDVYKSNIKDKTRRQSTMCFDILRGPSEGGTWKPEYTLSSLFASLMAAIVSFYVMQTNGHEKPEYVSMITLEKVKRDAKNTYKRHRHKLPAVPRIPLVEATSVPARCLFSPGVDIEAGNPETVTSEPIYLQTGTDEVYSFAVDLSNLHNGTVFSVVLSNNPQSDLVGRKPATILIRNGVTATAARKRANEPTKWFYHGKPMNDGDMRLHVTIGRDQMTFAYYEDGRLYVHGDCPVSRLSEECIGDVKGMPFYVHIFTKNKSVVCQGGPAADKPVVIKVLDIEGKGYIHESVGKDERTDFGFELVEAVEAEDEDGLSEDFGGIRLD